MKSVEWKTYRTRFLIKAKQLNSALTFTDPLGRTHCGRKGDYLVESSEGVLSITPRQIFEDIYVSMPEFDLPSSEKASERDLVRTVRENSFTEHFDGFDFEDQRTLPQPLARARRDEAARVRRKLPQPYRERRSSASRIGVM